MRTILLLSLDFTRPVGWSDILLPSLELLGHVELGPMFPKATDPVSERVF